ncbi:MAG: extracellular solute-binding protein [Solirubrobacteraceae bacterium]
MRALRLRGSVAALGVALTVALAGCGSSSTSSGAAPSASSATSSAASVAAAESDAGKTLIVFGAGTLANPWAQEFSAFKQLHSGVTIHSNFGASGDRIKAITQLHEPADVLGSADYSLIPSLMFPHYATWYVGFVSNMITFAYTSHSKGASQLTAANWYKVLAEPGVKIGRSNPAADPSGYQILQMLKLAQGYYHDPSISASVLRNSPDSSVAETETSLLAAVQSGQIDYLAIYRSDALQNHLKYINLPPQISLSNPALAKHYATVTTQGATSATVQAKPIIYGVTIPSNAPDKAVAQQFVAFLLGPQGRAIMARNGFVLMTPALAADRSAAPASIQALTRSWAGQ